MHDVSWSEVSPPASYFVLAARLDGPLHRYAIAARAHALSGGDVRLTAGTLYGALERLAGRGLVRVEREETVEGRLRRYALTGEGHKARVAEADRLAAATRVVKRRRTAGVARGVA